MKKNAKEKQERIDYLNSLLPRDDDGYFLDVNGERVHLAGNPLLSRPNTRFPLTSEHVKEIQKCLDFRYFVENYVGGVLSLDEGLTFITLRDYQLRIVDAIDNNRFVITKASRQSGKSLTLCLYILHSFLFKPPFIAGIMANKLEIAQNNLSTITTQLLSVPVWMRPGLKVYNKRTLVSELDTKIMVSASSPDAFRGKSLSFLFVDEVSFCPNFEEVEKSVIPTVSSGKQSKIVLTSTPNGFDSFYRIWTGAEQGTNPYVPVSVEWDEVEGRDEKFREMIIAQIGLKAWNQEYATLFTNSVDTLVDMNLLTSIPKGVPQSHYPFGENVRVYQEPLKGHNYILVADGAKGAMDFFAFHIIDVTFIPFRQVVSGSIGGSYLKVPPILYNLLREYNQALLVIENNEGAGTSVLDLLFQQYDYENIYSEPGKKWFGVRTTKGNRSKNLSNMKLFIESKKLILQDGNTIEELLRFVNVNGKYQAQDASVHDDLVMALSLLFVPLQDNNNIVDYNAFLKELSHDSDEEYLETQQFLELAYFDDGFEEKKDENTIYYAKELDYF